MMSSDVISIMMSSDVISIMMSLGVISIMMSYRDEFRLIFGGRSLSDRFDLARSKDLYPKTE